MKDILTDIVASKRKELALQRQLMPAPLMRHMAEEAIQAECTRSMSRALAASPTGIIAEFKRRSPSKGWIHRTARVADVVPAYQAAGASALSVLTDGPYFGGSLDDLRQARGLTGLPILRKDFIVDEYQLWQARAAGADAVLLIAACLERDTCRRLAQQAHALGLEVLLEVHSPDELAYVDGNTDMLGVNNRHLGTFHTDVQTSFRMAGQLAAARQKGKLPPLLVSESGIAQPDTVNRLRAAGFRGFLIGEALMKTGSPGTALDALLDSLQRPSGNAPK